MAKKRNMDDKRFKNFLIRWLKKNGFYQPSSGIHHRFKSLKVINTPTDLEGITTDGIVFRFEVKGHYVKPKSKALVSVYFDEVKDGVDNPNNTFYVLIRKEENKFLDPLFFTINQILKLLAVQKPQLKGSIYTDGVTQEDINNDKIKYPSRREGTLVADKNMIRGLDKTFRKLKNYKITNKPGVKMDKYPPILLESILYGATSGNKEGVTALVNQYSNGTTKNSKINKPKKSSKAAAERKKKHFESNCLNSIDVENEPTMSVKEYMMQNDCSEVKASTMSRFYSSKLSTDLDNKGVKMVDTGEGKQTDRYHFRKCDLN